ncbi:branched-chain amino acid transaminase [Candidatus Micrarchaeota archaeon]|nr:branched-chain amino acid transaminase [Candidatus Micrarchaeota archaeon]
MDLISETKFIWFNGKNVAWKDATIHALNHSLHYGSGVFEGIRCYKTSKGPAVFRLQEHMARLIKSCESYEIPSPYTAKEFEAATLELIKENKVDACYIRPLVFYGYGHMGLNPKGAKVEALIACWPWGTYLGEEGLEKGINAKISKWRRIHSSTLPMQAKCSGNYANSILGKLDAVNNGFDEAIMLNIEGRVAEGPGENIFLVKNSELVTPSVGEGILKGITRDSIIQIAKEFGIKVVERPIERDELFDADELFFTGTAAEVTPIRSVDKKIIGSGKRGPITKKLQEKFFQIVKGEDKKYDKWLS